MAAFDDVLSGSFTSTGAAKFISLPCGADYFEVHIRGNAAGDNWNSNANPGVTKSAWWQSGMASGTALSVKNTDGALTDQRLFLASNGFTPVTSAANLYGPAVAGTNITAVNPAVLNVPSDPYLTGDVVLLEAGAGVASKQMLGIPWSLTRTGAGTYTLNNAFDGSALVASGPVVTRKLLYPGVFTPYLSYIVSMTLGATTTVRTSYPHGLSAGQTVRLVVPSPWGATALNGQQALITSVPDAWTIVLALNSSAASAFVFPSVAAANAGVTWPQVVPIAEDASTFVGSFTDQNYSGMILGSSVVGPAGALVVWRAQHSLKVFTS